VHDFVLCSSRYVGCESPTSVHSEFVPRRGFDGQPIGTTRHRRFGGPSFVYHTFVSLNLNCQILRHLAVKSSLPVIGTGVMI